MFVSVRVEPGFRTIDYDAKRIKAALRSVGQDVRKEARRLISKKAVSVAGGFPGKDSGEMQRSIRAHVSKSGFSVAVYPTKTARMPAFYPAFVVYGHRGPGTETETERRRHKQRAGEKVAKPRANFIFAAAEKKESAFKAAMEEALFEAIK